MTVRQTELEVRHALTPRKAQQRAEEGSGWYALLARGGLVAKGLSFAIVGFLALKLAIGDGGKTTSREGALQTIAHHSYGKALLIALACGFAAYALWRFVQAFAERGDSGGSTAKTWGKRAGYIARGLIYAGLTFSTVKILLGAGGGQSQNQKAHKTAALVLSWPAGTWLVGAAGLAMIAAGLWNFYRAVTHNFEKKWRTGEMNETARAWGRRVGVVGHLARGVVFSLIGIFVMEAALDYNPRDAIGLDGALQKLAHASYGPYLLGLTAAGLICYALYCFVDARYRDVSTSA